MILMFYFYILGQNIDLGSLIDYNNLLYLLAGNTNFWFFKRLEQNLFINRPVLNEKEY